MNISREKSCWLSLRREWDGNRGEASHAPPRFPN
jgi:hypothetical protein